MRALTLILVILAVACATDRIELFPQDLATVGDGPTLPSSDLLAPPGSDLASPPDLTTTCVCRLLLCRADADCKAVAADSTCDSSSICSGGGITCRAAADCAAGAANWRCTQGPLSTQSCP